MLKLSELTVKYRGSEMLPGCMTCLAHHILICMGRALQDTSVLYQYRYDWMDQFWAANILLATLTDGGTFHSQAQSFLKFWICGTDRVRSPRCHSSHHHCLNAHLLQTELGCLFSALLTLDLQTFSACIGAVESLPQRGVRCAAAVQEKKRLHR